MQVGAYKNLETSAQFRIVPTLTLNFINEKPTLGFYKIQNDLSDYKKLIVLFFIFFLP